MDDSPEEAADMVLNPASACKWPYAIVAGNRKHISQAVRGERGLCPVCGQELCARKGAIKKEHWWHINGRMCDSWYEGKGSWHRYWQNFFPEPWQECVIEKGGVRHVADIKTSHGVIVEVQWSTISPEKILAREQFYGPMMWIVGMRRYRRASSYKEALGHPNVCCDSVTNLHILSWGDWPESFVWLNCTRPVFFDFEGDFEHPEGSGPLYYLVPAKKDGLGVRYVVSVDREELVGALLEGSQRELFGRLKAICDKDRNERFNRRNIQLEQMRAAQLEQRELQREVERLHAMRFFDKAETPRHAIEFAARRFHTPPRFALTLGWVNGYIVFKAIVDHIKLPIKFENRPPYGRVAIHFASRYAQKDYERDLLIAHKCGVGEAVPPFEDLKVFEGRIVACLDYLVKRDGAKTMFTFQNPAQVFRLRKKAYFWDRPAVGVWDLPDKTQEYISTLDHFSKRIFSNWNHV